MTTITLPAERFKLSKGAHGTEFKGEACVKELQTIAMGERFSDKPACISPIIDRLEIALNERLPVGEQRDRLLPFAYRALGTRGDGRDEERRQMCNEWLLHYALPTLLDKAGKTEVAARLRSLPCDLAVAGVRKAIYEAREEARDARKTAVEVEKLKAQILAELKKRNVAAAVAVTATVTAAVTVAAAAAVAVTVTVAATEAATAAAAVAATEAATATATVTAAAAVAVTVAATATAAVAIAATATEAATEVATAAAAVAVAATEAATEVGSKGYWEIRAAVRDAVYAKVNELFKSTGDDLIEGAFDLLDRMLPAAPLKPPVIENAETVFGVAA